MTTSNGSGLSKPWIVSGVARGSAMVVSTHDGGAAYGGTPSDRSVMDAIAEIKARGLKVTLYPFIMMDVAADNALPDPYGNPSQPAYPWRGRITCDPAPLMPDTADRTATARVAGRSILRQRAARAVLGVGEHDQFLGLAHRLGLPPLRAAPCAAGGSGRRRRRVPCRQRASRADDAARRERRFSVRRATVRAGGRCPVDRRAGDQDQLRRGLERIFRAPSGRRHRQRLFPSRSAVGAS